MKKTLVALTVAAFAATAANAAVVYNQDGTKVEVSGSARVALGKFGKDQRADLRNDGSRLIFKAEHELGNGLKALAGYELRFKGGVDSDNDTPDTKDDDESSNTFGSPETNKLYAGLAYDAVGTLTFGKQATTADDVSLSDFAYIWGGNNNLVDADNKVVKFKSAEWSGFSFGTDYLFGDSSKQRTAMGATELKLKYGYGVSLFYTRDLAEDLALNLAAGYGVYRFDNETTTNTVAKDTSWRTSAQIVYGPASFGVEYGQTGHKENDVKTQTDRSLLVGASYQVIEPSKVYLQWQRNQTKFDQSPVDNKETENVYIVGADYKFTKNVVTFVEYARSTTKVEGVDNKEKENKYAAGLRVYF
ncbi:putative porin [Bisgaardia hudsonensis]|uniref:Putative porin n=1 Tax=Bisgaardia hudsonensis TaxID=109472 RepID=A0A4R2N2Q2_9PAST|nr:porin [Bisgaardia hudsonensis]QLB12565.1 hypothetical protein A6A11_02570 [Bisgaardia hudsonensis]TCP14107.1 putative porin [Bisgaardia hudsonensis]